MTSVEQTMEAVYEVMSNASPFDEPNIWDDATAPGAGFDCGYTTRAAAQAVAQAVEAISGVSRVVINFGDWGSCNMGAPTGRDLFIVEGKVTS